MLKYWNTYWYHSDPIVGIFTIIAAFLTIIAIYWSYRAVKVAKESTESAQKSTEAAHKSTEIAKEALDKATENAQRDEFVRHFSMLLDQHNSQLEIVKSYLDGVENKVKGSEQQEGEKLLNALIQPISHLEAFNKLRGHRVISPYMRILYHLLKYVSEDFYIINATIEQKKKYTSIVRSLIRNDVLFLVAVNASYIRDNNVENQYANFQKYLYDFDFFEHAIFFSPSKANEDKDEVKINEWHIGFKNGYENFFLDLISNNGKSNEDKKTVPLFTPAIIISVIYNNPQHDRVITLLSGLPKSLLESFDNAINSFSKKNENKLNVDAYFKDFLHAKIFDKPKNNHLSDSEARLTGRNQPKIDIKFIHEAISRYKEYGAVSENNQIYYFENRTNSDKQMSSYQLNKKCEAHLDCVGSIEKATGGMYSKHIEEITTNWIELFEEIKCQSCALFKV